MDELSKLEEKWRQDSLACKLVCTPEGLEEWKPRADALDSCANELAALRPVIERLVGAGEALRKRHRLAGEFPVTADNDEARWDAALEAYRELHSAHKPSLRASIAVTSRWAGRRMNE
jgi:hypothetical protein